MVSFPAVGRMGNFLFECATGLGYALRHKLDFTVPFETTNEQWSPIYLKHLQNPNWNNGLQKIDLWENGHHYQELPFDESWRDKNIFVHGYRQSEKYFADYRNEILSLFNYPYEKKEGIVACHVRRGDYLHLRDKHPEVTKEWYEAAMNRFDGYEFKFFSDDINWCRQTFGSRNDCQFSTNDHIERDLVELASCEHQVCSPSTFAWWGMWLNRNENKRVVFPKFWFNPGWDGLNTDNIVPEWCEKF
jgi:hypothetical protein